MSASSSASAPGWSLSVKGAVVRGPLKDKYDTILTNEAVQFLADLHRKFEQTSVHGAARAGESGRAT